MRLDECNAPNEGCAAPNKDAKERRESMVIKETHELLNGLQADAVRSEALMAELEALLASSQAASGEAAASGPPQEDAGAASVVTTAHFVSVQPLEVVSDIDVDDADADTLSGEVSPSRSSADVARRRSSTIYMDGASLFATNDAAGSVSWPPARGDGPLPAVPGPRQASFTRGRAGPLHGMSFAECRANLNSRAHRRTGVDLGYAPPVTLAAALRRASSGSKGVVMQATPAPRTSNEFPSPFLLQQRSPPSMTAATAPIPSLPESAAVPLSQRCQSAWPTERCDGLVRLDAQSSSEAAECRGAGVETGSKERDGAGEEAGRPGSRAGSKRFMNLFHLKGIFTAHKHQGSAKSAPQAYVNYTTTSSSGQPLSPTGSGGSGRNEKLPDGGASALTASYVAQEPAVAAAAGEDLVFVRRAGSLTGVSTRALARGTSLRIAMLATSTSATAGVFPSTTASAPARSLGGASSYSGARSVQEGAPSRASQVPPVVDGSKTAVAWPVSGANSRRSLICALPQIG